jgi:hypothetical protein
LAAKLVVATPSGYWGKWSTMRLHAFLSVQLGHPQVQPEDLDGQTIMKIKKSVENIIFICHIEVALA